MIEPLVNRSAKPVDLTPWHCNDFSPDINYQLELIELVLYDKRLTKGGLIDGKFGRIYLLRSLFSRPKSAGFLALGRFETELPTATTSIGRSGVNLPNVVDCIWVRF